MARLTRSSPIRQSFSPQPSPDRAPTNFVLCEIEPRDRGGWHAPRLCAQRDEVSRRVSSRSNGFPWRIGYCLLSKETRANSLAGRPRKQMPPTADGPRGQKVSASLGSCGLSRSLAPRASTIVHCLAAVVLLKQKLTVRRRPNSSNSRRSLSDRFRNHSISKKRKSKNSDN